MALVSKECSKFTENGRTMFRIFGPPGTGKTTSLLNRVDRALEDGVPPEKIAFLAFTRKAANEARERAAARFNLDPDKDLFFFRTLHSLALVMTDIKPSQIMSDEHYSELEKKIGVQITGRKVSYDDSFEALSQGSNPIIALINLARLRKVTLREQYNHSQIWESWTTVEYVEKALYEYKKAYTLYDFTDLLEYFIAMSYKLCPQFELCFLDEAQDLSPMQWDIAHILDENSTKMYVAGDDDQAIYKWSGADVEHFINLPGGSETLSQSYRVPKSIHRLAEDISSKIVRRFPKKYNPKDEEGKVERIFCTTDVDMSEGTWLILSQAGYQLQPIYEELRSAGYLFSFRGRRSISEQISIAVNGWEQLRKGKEVTVKTARVIYGYMNSGSRIKRGYKKIPNLDGSDLINLDTLIDKQGLLATKDMIWSEAMDKIPTTERAYITALLRRGEKFNREPRITASTIHASKGGEADNVVLLTDLSTAAEESLRDDPDSVHRVFYVAVTRSKKNLFIVEPAVAHRGYYL